MELLRPSGTSAADAAADIALLDAWLQADDPADLVIGTSGSSGRPKHVVLGRDAVLASAEASLARIGVRGRWRLEVPSGYVAGVQVVVRSLLSGHAPALPGDPAPVVATSVVPTQAHRALAQDPAALAAFEVVLVGGGPVDPRLRADAAAAGVNLVATYGASETAGGCVYDGRPLDGVRMAIEEPDSNGAGRVLLGGPTLFRRYDGDEQLTAETLVGGWYRTADRGRIVEDRLEVLGRIDDVVISGGVNVPLPAVAARLRAHAALAAAEVVGVPDEEWGHRVVALVVTAGGEPATGTLRDWVSAVHPRSWAPREVIVLDSMPLLGNGKPDRQRLHEIATGQRRHETASREAR